MSDILQTLWQTNIEISLLLLVIFILRYVIRKTTRIYNAYLLWLSIPAGLLIAKIVAQLSFSPPPVASVNYIVQSYIIKPTGSFEPWLYAGQLWVAVTCLLLFRLLRQHLQLRRDLRSIRHRGTLDFSSKYPIIAIDKEDFSPAVYGFFRPKIYFPIQLLGELSQEQIALIIQHEEHHIKNSISGLICYGIFWCAVCGSTRWCIFQDRTFVTTRNYFVTTWY